MLLFLPGGWGLLWLKSWRSVGGQTFFPLIDRAVAVSSFFDVFFLAHSR